MGLISFIVAIAVSVVIGMAFHVNGYGQFVISVVCGFLSQVANRNIRKIK